MTDESFASAARVVRRHRARGLRPRLWRQQARGPCSEQGIWRAHTARRALQRLSMSVDKRKRWRQALVPDRPGR